MISIASLVLPIVVSAVAVFIVSFLVHMLLKYHSNDCPALPNQDAVMDALRKFNIAPGDYMMPRAKDMKAMKEPAFQEKFKQGPVIWMTVLPNGEMTMGKNLVQWFIYCLIVNTLIAIVACRFLGPEQAGSAIMLPVAVVGFLAYAAGQWPDSIWYRRKWSTTIKNTVDGALYGLATGAVFMLMWPKG